MNKYTKWFIGIIGTILLGAIGSGVWDWILSGFFSWLGVSLLSIASGISQAYLDLLYKDVWRGAEYSYLKEIHVLTFVIYLMMPVILFFSRSARKTKKTNEPKKLPNLYVLVVLVSALAITLTIKVWETSFSVRTASVLTANINIVKPYIINEDAMKLESMLYRVKDQKSAVKLKNSIEKVADEHGADIHSMDFI